jgi:GT2 family glycosyltransferase
MRVCSKGGGVSLDVVICTRNRPQELAACLRSLATQTQLPDTAVIVDSSDEPQPLPDVALPVRRLLSPAGLPLQRNLALRHITSDLVTFLDDDVELEPEYIATIKRWFRDTGDCVGASGNITNDPRRPALSRAFRRLFDLANDDGMLRRSGDVAYLRHPHIAARVDVIAGANMTFRRRALDGVRFREDLGRYAYMEDADVALQLGKVGTLWMLPGARLVHHRSPVARLPRREFVAEVLRNSTLLFVAHRDDHALSLPHFLRRMAGRVMAYATLAIRAGSPRALLGLVDGIRASRTLLRAASNRSRAARDAADGSYEQP